MLARSVLFRGATSEEIDQMLGCLRPERRQFAKGQAILRTGDTTSSLGIVLSGRVLIEHIDLWGNSAVLDSIGPSQIFAESYACTPGEPLMVDVTAAEPCEVLFLSISRVLQTCPRTCAHHTRLIRALLALTAQKNLTLSRKIFHTAPKSIRARLLSYLSWQAIRNGSRCFTIPFDRRQLAEYLNVDRSALSNELSKMRREGLLRAEKNRFELLDMPETPQ